MTRRQSVADALLAVLLLVIGLGGTTAADQRSAADTAVDGWALALVVVAAVALAARRRWPITVLAVVTVATSTYLLLGYPYGPILLSFLVAVYTLARHVRLGVALPVAAGALLVLLTHVLRESNPLGAWASLVPGAAWLVVPFAVGVVVRYADQSRAQTRAEVVRQQVHEERMRVAQEVHDVVGHGLAAIKMQADVALHVLPKKPEQGEVALRAISTSSAAALDELRATLAAVRQADDSRAPAPGLARLEDLEQRMAHAGVRVQVVTEGEVHELPAEVDLVAYRIVQESLTNVLRHAGSNTATVRVVHSGEVVTVEVRNPGEVGAPAPVEGSGIAGMRERVRSLGGTFDAGPAADGSFVVRAELPLGARA